MRALGQPRPRSRVQACTAADGRRVHGLAPCQMTLRRPGSCGGTARATALPAAIGRPASRAVRAGQVPRLKRGQRFPCRARQLSICRRNAVALAGPFRPLEGELAARYLGPAVPLRRRSSARPERYRADGNQAGGPPNRHSGVQAAGEQPAATAARRPARWPRPRRCGERPRLGQKRDWAGGGPASARPGRSRRPVW